MSAAQAYLDDPRHNDPGITPRSILLDHFGRLEARIAQLEKAVISETLPNLLTEEESVALVDFIKGLTAK